MKAFDIEDTEVINNVIFELINQKESEIQQSRVKDGKTFMGALRLISQGIRLDYQPNRSGKRMWCICKNKQERISYINWVKELAREARAVYKSWKAGGSAMRMPVGMFAPRMPVLANLIFLN